MFQLLLFLLAMVLVVLLIAAVAIVVFVRRGVSKLRGAADRMTGGAFRGNADDYANGTGQRSQGYRSGRQTISDTRPDEVARRRIIADDEGEYVDFHEVK